MADTATPADLAYYRAAGINPGAAATPAPAPAALPPQFVGRYAGAPLPTPAAQPTLGYTPRFDTNAPAVQAAQAAALPAAPAAAPAATAAPANADPTLAARMADVPDGGRLVTQPAAGTPPSGAPALPATASAPAAGLINPQAAISAGYDRQQAYAQNFMDQALSYIGGGGDIFERATRGRAIAGILHAVAGQNNEGSAQAQGADGYNSALAGITNANTMAGASMYDAGLNRENVQDTNANRMQLAQFDAVTTPRNAGSTSTIGQDGITRVQQNVAVPNLPGMQAPSFTTLSPQRETAKAAPIVGARYRDANGNESIYQADGTYKAVGQ